MQTHAFNFVDSYQVGTAWPSFFALRKREFVDNKGWRLPHTDRAEWDAYDTPSASYVVVERDGHCLGGARIIKTSAHTYGPYRYMLLDAAEGILEAGIPKEMLPTNLPQCDTVVEATRFVVDNTLGRREILETYSRIVVGVQERSAQLGAETILALMPCAVYRIFRRLGFEIEEIGSPGEIDGVVHSVGRMLPKFTGVNYSC